ncbi:amidohydrolase family protein [Streptomyces iconiensis]|uniref:Amidohydrolase family protein n=1 Tax=Streptomyces iconiensis TaxID=1384038 RepID=A0ABT6ZR06_9ACTN|nr:amidohydrolase family protein [Streptomyces iconiensis]MDJ1131277.1 amidohydrolase family protein [Streptomyces iconiensis]
MATPAQAVTRDREDSDKGPGRESGQESDRESGRESGKGSGKKPGPEAFDGEALLLVPDRVLLPKGVVKGHAVLVKKGVFRDIGPAAKLTAAHPHLKPVRLEHHLLMPGFVDAHHHLTQSFGKAQAFGQPSEIFKSVWEPLEHALDEDSAYLAAKLAALESLRGGFTTVADAGTRAPVDVEVVAKGAEDAGVRCVLSKVVSDGKGGREHLERWNGHPLIHPSLAVPVPEDATAGVLRRTARMCEEAGAVFQTHVNEHLAAVERSLKSVGRRPLAYLHHVGALGPHTLGAHATLLAPHELKLLADTGAAVSYNPVASAWKGNAVAQATMMAALGVRFGTGTDGTRGDGFRMIDAAESAQRLTSGIDTGDSVCGAGRLWLDHATAGSADAVGLGRTTGKIAVGKAADFLLVDLDVPELTPSWDLEWELVRLANRDQITAVVVAGRLRLWHGWPPHWDGKALVRRAGEVGREVVRRADIDRVDPTPGR